ncbi:MAG: hypothetical protein KGH98_02925, partial [Candidatus Micrarchaeota archaeon]|nr:hypothetical protein [Candidatus Micrarchaeota archaeon]
VKPRENYDINSMAMRIMGLGDIEEIHVTEGICGFLVKARFHSDGQSGNVRQWLSKVAGSNCGELISHYTYKKH